MAPSDALHSHPRPGRRRLRAGFLDDTERGWRSPAERIGAVGPDGVCRIVSDDPGSSWLPVRVTATARGAEHLATVPGQPEFIVSSPDGSAICGVETEEEGIWIVALRRGPD